MGLLHKIGRYIIFFSIAIIIVAAIYYGFSVFVIYLFQLAEKITYNIGWVWFIVIMMIFGIFLFNMVWEWFCALSYGIINIISKISPSKKIAYWFIKIYSTIIALIILISNWINLFPFSWIKLFISISVTTMIIRLTIGMIVFIKLDGLPRI